MSFLWSTLSSTMVLNQSARENSNICSKIYSRVAVCLVKHWVQHLTISGQGNHLPSGLIFFSNWTNALFDFPLWIIISPMSWSVFRAASTKSPRLSSWYGLSRFSMRMQNGSSWGLEGRNLTLILFPPSTVSVVPAALRASIDKQGYKLSFSKDQDSSSSFPRLHILSWFKVVTPITLRCTEGLICDHFNSVRSFSCS